MEDQGRKYDLFLGTSTGSLLIPHLAVNDIGKLYDIFTNVKQRDVFSISPFVQHKKDGREFVSINYFNSLIQFVKRKRTFGESGALRRNIKKNFTEHEFNKVRKSGIDVVVTVANLSKSSVEYKSIREFKYEEFCDWIWISCNYIPFMSLAVKNGFEYADGGLGCVVPIREAIQRGATEIDAIILESENMEDHKVLGKNPFSLMVNLFSYLLEQVEKSDVTIGQLAAINKNVKLNLYYTPTKLTENSLIFSKKLMTNWWEQGYEYAQNKYESAVSNEVDK